MSESWTDKCLSCTHSYRTKDDADELKCRCRNGKCNYKPLEEKNTKMDSDATGMGVIMKHIAERSK